MELWIRSQDKEKLMLIDYVKYIGYFYDEEEQEHCIGTYMFVLGTYKTKERALEVLDEIQKYILLPNPDGSAYVYQMPEK